MGTLRKPAADRVATARRRFAMEVDTKTPLSDDEIETIFPGTATPIVGQAVEDPQDTDGTDSGDTDGTDSGDTDGTDSGDTDGTDSGDTDGTDS
jgi:hypothetical protein